jgi:hypothetical protein
MQCEGNDADHGAGLDASFEKSINEGSVCDEGQGHRKAHGDDDQGWIRACLDDLIALRTNVPMFGQTGNFQKDGKGNETAGYDRKAPVIRYVFIAVVVRGK